jgi:hypothetical protein
MVTPSMSWSPWLSTERASSSALLGLGECGPFDAVGFEDRGEHCPSRGRHDLGGLSNGCVGWECAGDRPGGVGVPAAGQPDVGAARRGSGGEDEVRGVDGAALRGVHGGGVAEGQVLVDIAARQLDWFAGR